jgi:hypothetical protein
MSSVQAISLTADGDFSFLDPVVDGSPYHVVGNFFFGDVMPAPSFSQNLPLYSDL